MKHEWLYDIEVYPNLFLLGAKIPGTTERRRFQISPLGDDREALALWMLEEVNRMIGYNNLSYDYPVLHKLILECKDLRGSQTVRKLFQYSSKLVKSNGFPPRLNYLRPQVDLFKINHFDNKAKMTSLKLLEFNLRLKNLQALPYRFDKELTEQEIFDVIAYNDNDVDATELVYNETKFEIDLRDKMSPKYGIDFTNFNSTKMGEHILISKIVEEMGEDVLYNEVPTENGGFRKVIRNTQRESIDMSEVVFDYIEFRTEPFKRILTWFKNLTITETKGALTQIPFEDLKMLEPYYEVIAKKGKQQNLNVVYNGFRYDFGVGGIHGCTSAGIYEEDDEWEQRDVDVASYYPNLSIENDFYPEHIGPHFCVVYKGMYEERKLYPKKTHLGENLTLKLGLNGSYGKSNSEYSPLCDPKYTMLTTVNGQLLLCKLAEELQERVPDSQMLQINTDGLTLRYKKCFAGLVDVICREWEAMTRLELEDAYYSKMIIRDVNNYIGIYRNGKIKRKGAAFIYKIQPGELELHKNFSQLVVPKALEAYFIDGVLPEDFFRDHDDVYDFFKRTKIPGNSKLVSRIYDEDGNIVQETLGQNISRYLITGKTLYDKKTKKYSKVGRGETLIKIMPALKGKEEKGPREFNVEEGWLCTVVNTLPDNLDDLKSIINYDYYINEAYKVINAVENRTE